MVAGVQWRGCDVECAWRSCLCAHCCQHCARLVCDTWLSLCECWLWPHLQLLDSIRHLVEYVEVRVFCDKNWCLNGRDCDARRAAESQITITVNGSLTGQQLCVSVEDGVWTGIVGTLAFTSQAECSRGTRVRARRGICAPGSCVLVCDRIQRVEMESEGASYPVSLHRAAADLSMQSHVRLFSFTPPRTPSPSVSFTVFRVLLLNVIASMSVCVTVLLSILSLCSDPFTGNVATVLQIATCRSISALFRLADHST